MRDSVAVRDVSAFLAEADRKLARITELQIAMMLARWRVEWGKPSVVYKAGPMVDYEPTSIGGFKRHVILTNNLLGLAQHGTGNVIISVDAVEDQVRGLLEVLDAPGKITPAT